MRWLNAIVILISILTIEVLVYPFVLNGIRVISTWAYALPNPSQEFASLVGGIAWPLALILLALVFWSPLNSAAKNLAVRFRKGRIRLGNLLEIEDVDVFQWDGVAGGTGSSADAFRAEGLMEFGGQSDENWQSLVNWINDNVRAGLDPEEFVSSPKFAEQRQNAYIALIGTES